MNAEQTRLAQSRDEKAPWKKGLGASHQTGWTGVVAKRIQLFGRLDANTLLEAGNGAFRRGESEGEAKP
jgi:hypothetical protein